MKEKITIGLLAITVSSGCTSLPFTDKVLKIENEDGNKVPVRLDYTLTQDEIDLYTKFLQDKFFEEEVEKGGVIDPEEKIEVPEPTPPRTDVVEKPGREYKWVGDKRYQKHPTEDKWLHVDDRGNWLPLSNTSLIKFTAHGGGRSVVLIQNNIFEFHVDHDNPNAVKVNGSPWKLQNDHANGGRGHYYGPSTNGPCTIELTLKDGTVLTHTVPQNHMRTDRPNSPGDNWRFRKP